MNLDSLTQNSGEWLRGTGAESDIVISSRIRLARNMSSFPFTNRASAHQKAEIETALRERLAKMEYVPHLEYLNVPTLAPSGPPTPRRTPAHQPGVGQHRWTARRRRGPPGKRQHHD